MKSIKIKALIEEFQRASDNCDTIEAALLNKSLSDTDRDDLEEEFEFWDKQLYEIADAIKHLNPSKYMMNKYLEIEHILTFT